ncbi:Ras GTPase [Emmonsiellopsis sp. PD_33]|nr:Ras GTPase [Emmonsiellopsis sp. PD_33]
MQLCESFFAAGRAKKLRNHLPRPDTHGRNDIHTYKLVIGGSVSQCVMSRIILGHCFHDPTLEATFKFSPWEREDWRKDPYQHTCTVDDDDDRVSLKFLPMPDDSLWSTQAFNLQCLRDADGLIVVFCIEQRESFEKLVDDSKFLLRLKAENDIPLILVGGQPGYCESVGDMRQVAREEAEDFAQALGARYFEIRREESIKNGDYAPVQYLVRDIRRKSLPASVS